MNDELNPSDDVDSTDEVELTDRTAEEVEEFWKKRVSGKDRAHNSEIEALKAQHAADLAALKGQTAEETDRSAKVTDDLAKLQAENAALKAERDSALATAKVTDLKSRFPHAAAELGDDLTALSEERLTALDAKLTPTAGGAPDASATPFADMQSFILENSQPRRFDGQQPAQRQTSADLERQLEAAAGEVLNW